MCVLYTVCTLYTVCEQTKLRCEEGELEIKLNVFTNEIRLKDNFQSGTAQRQQPNLINISKTRGNANRCHLLLTTYPNFQAFKFFFPAASLISTAAKLFTSKVLVVFYLFLLGWLSSFFPFL